jgi:hypothetical protein
MPLLHITWHKKSNNPTPRKRGHTKVSKLTGGRSRGALKTYALAAQEKLHCRQPSLPIAVTGHIDGVIGSLNNGITSHRGELGTRFASQLITWSKSTWSTNG